MEVRRRSVRLSRDRPPEVRHAALSDAVLAVRARHGDRQALDALVNRHAGAVEAQCRHLLHDREDARDAAQEALHKLCRRVGQYRGEARFSTWLHTLVANTCRDLVVHEARRRHDELDEESPAVEADVAAAALDAASAAARRPALRAALATLSPAQRRAVVLRDVLALGYRDIARELELPLGTVKCHVHRAHAALRDRLDEPLRKAS